MPAMPNDSKGCSVYATEVQAIQVGLLRVVVPTASHVPLGSQFHIDFLERVRVVPAIPTNAFTV